MNSVFLLVRLVIKYRLSKFRNLHIANVVKFVNKLHPSSVNTQNHRFNTFKTKLLNWFIENSFYLMNEFIT